MRFIVPPDEGSVQKLPCMSAAMVRPSGEIDTDIEVPSRTVTSMALDVDGAAARRGAGRGCDPCCAARPATIRRMASEVRWRVMRRILAHGLHGLHGFNRRRGAETQRTDARRRASPGAAQQEERRNEERPHSPYPLFIPPFFLLRGPKGRSRVRLLAASAWRDCSSPLRL